MNVYDLIEAEWVWMIPVLPLAAFVIISLFGKYLPGKGSLVSVGTIGIGFILSCLVLVDFISDDFAPVSVEVDWIRINHWTITWGFLVDRISIVMIGLITFVSLMVQVYSIGYMRGDFRLGWYFAVNALFAAAMLVLVLADNLIFLYFAWELVGLGSYLLIGFWYERRHAAEAAKKAFMTTRIGDVGLLIGIILLFKATGTFQISSIIHAAQNGGISQPYIICASSLLFMGAMGKSAQFPLHVWLPDAMEGPTPVSALIHAATMVAAGVYLVARMAPLFGIVPGVLETIGYIGLFTFLFGGTIALVMTDIKRILAYSTISHLGLMMLSLGAGGVAAALLHLVFHGIAKALLFLGAGNVMHGMKGDTYCGNMGGLRKRMPLTYLFFLMGALSLAGIAPLSGFFSKDGILVLVGDRFGPMFLIMTTAGIGLSALYISRLFFLVFHGDSRTNEARISRESPISMLLPLMFLAVIASIAGLLVIPIAEYEGLGSFIQPGHVFHMDGYVTGISLVSGMLGITIGWLLYGNNVSGFSSEKIATKFRPLHSVLMNKYYIDEIYQFAIDKLLLSFSRFIGVFDRLIVNDVGIDGPGMSVKVSALRIITIQTGKVYNYGAAMVFGVLIASIVWWLV